jgi:predicted nucleic acid-binding protein
MAGSSQYTVVLDANVLYGYLSRDLLLSLAQADLYHARWTNKITQEWNSNLVRNKPELAGRLDALVSRMHQAVPDCLVENFEHLIGSLTLPDPKDRHVLAAAIMGHADAIVTLNLKDFPQDLLDPYNIEVQHLDDFIVNQLEMRPIQALGAIKAMRARQCKPALTALALIELIERRGMPQTAQFLRPRQRLI